MDKSSSRLIAPLAVSHLTKRYGSSRGIEDVSFDVKAGEVFGFLGPNGAGKSTTIRTILGFLAPSEGSVSLFGKSVSPTALRQVGYLSGDFAAYEHLSGKAFLDYLASLNGSVDQSYVNHLVNRLGASVKRPIHTLSKGNKQKLGIIQAMMHRPKLLMFDEPTSGLDPLIKQIFYELLDQTCNENDTTVFFSSHDLSEVQKICDRAGFIRDGRVIGMENIAEMTKLQARRFVVNVASKPGNTLLAKLSSLADVELSDHTITCTVTGNMREFLSAVSLVEVVDLHEQTLSLEELFIHYYKNQEENS